MVNAPGYTTNIQVTACDNELYILGATIAGGPTSEICHITSGYNQPVNYSFNPGAVLAPGSHNLFIIGINWGAQADFSITLTSGGVVEPPITHRSDSGASVWYNIQQITVTPPS